MPKIYPDKQSDLDQKRDDRESGKKTMGVYDRPARKGPSRGVIIAIAITLLILTAIFFLSGFTMASVPLTASTTFARTVGAVGHTGSPG
jgi:hypothetical protein